MKDITAPKLVEIEIKQDKKVVWINVDGVCEFRACRIGELVVINHAELPPIETQTAPPCDEHHSAAKTYGTSV